MSTDIIDVLGLVNGNRHRWTFNAQIVDMASDFITELDSMDTSAFDYPHQYILKCMEMCRAASKKNDSDYGFVFKLIKDEILKKAEIMLPQSEFAKVMRLSTIFVITMTYTRFRKFGELIQNNKWQQHLSMELFIKPQHLKYFTRKYVMGAVTHEESALILDDMVDDIILGTPINIRYIEELITEAYPCILEGKMTIDAGQHPKFIIQWSVTPYSKHRSYNIDETDIKVDITVDNEVVFDYDVCLYFKFANLSFGYNNPEINKMLESRVIPEPQVRSESRVVQDAQVRPNYTFPKTTRDILHLLNLWEGKCALCSRLLELQPTHSNCSRSATICAIDGGNKLLKRNAIVVCRCDEADCVVCAAELLIKEIDTTYNNVIIKCVCETGCGYCTIETAIEYAKKNDIEPTFGGVIRCNCWYEHKQLSEDIDVNGVD
jgi:hypothetical protein